jgi:hypothetical protein
MEALIQHRKAAMAVPMKDRRKALVDHIEALGYKKPCNRGCNKASALQQEVADAVQATKTLNREEREAAMERLRAAPLKL